MLKPVASFLTDDLQRVLENLPPDEPRSRLEPFRAIILRWRREGRSYKRIRQALQDHCQVKVAHATLFKFVQRRSRPQKPILELQSATVAVPPETYKASQLDLLQEPVQIVENDAKQSPKPTKLTAEEVANQLALMRNLRNKPIAVLEAKKRFVYDSNEPLTLEQSKKDLRPE